MKEPMIRGLLLDMDGTLANSLPAMYQAYLDFLSAFGHQGTPEEFESLNGPSLLEVIETLKDRYRLPMDSIEIFGRYVEKITSSYPKLVEPHDGARELLESAKTRGMKIALVTSADRGTALAFLNAHSLKKYFSLVVTSDDVSRSKPDPAIYQIALDGLGLKSGEAVAVEDSIQGIRAATSALIPTIAIDPEGKLDLEGVPHLLAVVSRLSLVGGIIMGCRHEQRV